MANYKVVQRLDSGDVVVARIRGTKVTGVKARMVREVLAEVGWPANGVDPIRILNGSYLFAVPDPEPAK